ncbi:MAG: hypothetical protein RDU20_19400 [Desulfomonilaceae bacterium]|nr:hypothetical protein [Desulfomonilaceae bacterium]
MLCGNDGRGTFFAESDRLRVYDLLDEGLKRFDVRIAALRSPSWSDMKIT